MSKVQDQVRREYAALAPIYDDRWARYVEATTARTLAHLAVQPVDTLLDLGCGTGVLLRAMQVRHPTATLVGADLSVPMLQAARSRLAPGPRLGAAEAGRLPLAAGSVDVAVSVSSFHYWPDPIGGLREIARVLRPGGRLVLTDWCDDFLTCKLCDRWLRFTRRAYHRIYGSRECLNLLREAGFRVEALERYRVGWLWGTMTIAARHPDD